MLVILIAIIMSFTIYHVQRDAMLTAAVSLKWKTQMKSENSLNDF